jgi:hypothetical protein
MLLMWLPNVNFTPSAHYEFMAMVSVAATALPADLPGRGGRSNPLGGNEVREERTG